MTRPLNRHNIQQLEDLFSKSGNEPSILKQLATELSFRTVPKARALLERVQASISTPNANRPEIPSKQPSLWANLPSSAPPVKPIAPPISTTRTTVATPGVLPDVQIAPPISTAHTTIGTPTSNAKIEPISLAEACTLLKASLKTPWQEIEAARQRIVQLAHPNRIAQLSDRERKQALADAKRANEAYATLSHQRCESTNHVKSS